MRLMANENVPIASVRRLREKGHDVFAVGEDMPGATDLAILTRATAEDRTIVTFDRDYGELVYRQRIPAPAGIIYLRFAPETPTEPADVVLRVLQVQEIRLTGLFTVVEPDRVRQRPLTVS